MNKSIKKIIFSLFILISFFLTTTEVSANSVSKIEMDVYIDSYGNAKITEVWNAYLSQGTEGYRPYTNLGNSSISNFIISDDSGRIYESLSSWNVNASFDNKAYKSGLHYISNGVELCWGISNYGNRTYTLKYDISNFVTQYTDTQGIYFNFLNLDQSVDNAKIIIHSDIPFSLDNSRIWAFGNNGSINFEDGKIVLESGGFLSKSQYMVGLVRFETNLFNTSNSSSKSFDDVYDSAMSDVSKDELEYTDYRFLDYFKLFWKFIIWLIFSVCLNPVVLIIIVYMVLKKKKGSEWIWGSRKHSGYLDFGPGGKNIPSDDKIEYWREIPCNKDLERAYWVSYQYNVVSINTLRKGIIGAILLKWIKEEKITVSKTRKGLFSFKDNNYAIDFSKSIYCENKIENDLLEMLKRASGMNRILEAKEFEKWCKKNYSKIDSWFSTFIYNEQAELEIQQLITSRVEATPGMFGKTKNITAKVVSPVLLNDAIHLKGLKKFLLDFSIMPEREYFEVHIWEEYLIFAQLLGIADKVEEQFSKLYPNFSQVSKLDIDMTTIAVRSMVEIGYKGIEAGKRRAASSNSHDYSGSSRGSGGGGSSYSSGGSSSGGSSGGGFR